MFGYKGIKPKLMKWLLMVLLSYWGYLQIHHLFDKDIIVTFTWQTNGDLLTLKRKIISWKNQEETSLRKD